MTKWKFTFFEKYMNKYWRRKRIDIFSSQVTRNRPFCKIDGNGYGWKIFIQKDDVKYLRRKCFFFYTFSIYMQCNVYYTYKHVLYSEQSKVFYDERKTKK